MARNSHPSAARGNTSRRSHVGRKKTCPGCKEPEEIFVTIQAGGQNIDICTSCHAKIKARMETTKQKKRNDAALSRDVRDVMKNTKGDKRRGSEEIWQGSEHDDEWLDAEPIP